MRMLITGSRKWDDRATILGAMLSVSAFAEDDDTEIVVVHGQASSGADVMADEIAKRLGWKVEPHPAKWKMAGLFDRSAGFKRNQEMVDLGADVCLAFIKDGSGGATHCADRAEAAGIYTVRYIQGRETDGWELRTHH